MKKLKILVTGGAGYLGSVISTKLLEIGHNVTVIDILEFNKTSLSHLFIKKGFKFIEADVRNKELLKSLIKNKDVIIPLAALVGAPLCEKYPKKTKEINLDNIKYILSIIKPYQKLIYPNTNSGYGVGEKNNYCDVVVGFGVGSFFDLAKAVAIMENLEGSLFTYSCLFYTSRI